MAFKAFTSIAYAIPNCDKAEDIKGLFRVLCGSDPLTLAIKILPKVTLLLEYQPEHNPSNWMACSDWCEWWTRKNHLSKLCIV